MKVTIAKPIENSKAIRLQGVLANVTQIEQWQQNIQFTFDIFENLLRLGGLPNLFDRGVKIHKNGELIWGKNSFSYNWLYFKFDIKGIAILLRMLARLQINGMSIIEEIVIEGETPLTFSKNSVIDNEQVILNFFPEMQKKLPFILDIKITKASWINFQCEFNSPFSNDISQALDSAIQGWVNVVNAGGFQMLNEEDILAMGIQGPIEAEDFLEWYLQMHDTLLGSLNCLINILALFSVQTFPIRLVYFG